MDAVLIANEDPPVARWIAQAQTDEQLCRVWMNFDSAGIYGLNQLRKPLMPSPHKPDPYNGFKSDEERRRALNMRAINRAVVGVAIALSNAIAPILEKLLWLKTLFL